MNRIPTAKEFIIENLESMDLEDVERAMIHFARLHVQAAIKSVYNINGQTEILDSMFFIYPLSEIR